MAPTFKSTSTSVAQASAEKAKPKPKVDDDDDPTAIIPVPPLDDVAAIAESEGDGEADEEVEGKRGGDHMPVAVGSNASREDAAIAANENTEAEVESENKEGKDPVAAAGGSDDEVYPKLIMPGDRKKSRWWKYFLLFDPDHHPTMLETAKCILCGKICSHKSGTTSGISGHLKCNHPKEYDELCATEEEEKAAKKSPKPKSRFADRDKFIENPKLVKPEVKVYSKYAHLWAFFHLYDLNKHPEKKNMARCNICEKDIGLAKKGLALHRHITNWHEDEYNNLIKKSADKDHDPDETDDGDAESPIERDKKRLKWDHREDDSPDEASKEDESNDENKLLLANLAQEKHWFEQWEKTREILAQLQRDLKEEDDDDMREELISDIKKLRKRKAVFEDHLGMDDSSVD